MKHLRHFAALLGVLILAALGAVSPALAAGNTLTLTNPTYDTSTQKFGSAALKSGYGSVANPLSSMSAFTIEAWTKVPTSFTTSGTYVLMGFDNSSWVGFNNSLKLGGSTGTSGGPFSTSSASLNDGNWHHVALSYDGTKEYLYLDGVLVSAVATASPPSNPFRLGNFIYSSSTNTFQWPGEIDEAAVWNYAKYPGGTTFTPPTAAYAGSESGLLALYHLDSNGTDSQATVAATAYSLTGPSSGTVGSAYNFSVATNGALSSNVTITPAVSGGTGTFSPTSITLTSAQTNASFSFTPTSAGTDTLSTTNSGGLTDPSGLTFTSANAAIAIGSLTATPSAAGITIATSAALSGGTGSGYSYKIYRGTDPNFTVGAGSLLATVSSLPYVDTTAAPGQQYYYGLTGNDSAANLVNAVPNAISALASSPSTLLYASAQLNTPDLALVFAGDSITYGVGLSNPGTMNGTAPAAAVARVQKSLGIRNIYATNQGVSGWNTWDWCPGNTTTNTYTNAISAANASSAASALHTAHPSAKMVFSFMLGTNDSSYGAACGASSQGGAISSATYTANVQTITEQILSDWPQAVVIWHMSPYYTPNTHNGATYEQAGLSRLQGFRPALQAAISAEAAKHPGQVYLGDTFSFQYFSENYASELQADGSGPNGNFYLHPNATGATDLGELWGRALATDLYAPLGLAAPVFRPGFFH